VVEGTIFLTPARRGLQCLERSDDDDLGPGRRSFRSRRRSSAWPKPLRRRRQLSAASPRSSKRPSLSRHGRSHFARLSRGQATCSSRFRRRCGCDSSWWARLSKAPVPKRPQDLRRDPRKASAIGGAPRVGRGARRGRKVCAGGAATTISGPAGSAAFRQPAMSSASKSATTGENSRSSRAARAYRGTARWPQGALFAFLNAVNIRHAASSRCW
jgi:hypothetical protein